MKKIIILVMMCFFSFVYAQEENQDFVENDFNIGVLKGPSGIVFSYQMETLRELDGINVTYEIFANANQVVPKLLNEEIDLTVLPVNLATKLYTSSNGEIAILGICGNGMLSIISSDPSISALEDLKGKKIGVQKGTTGYLMISEAIANGVLKDTGAEVIEYANGPLAMAAMKNGRCDVVVIDELPAKKLVK
jgi:ABC-type nitrate/sulfonate/bicarbonate transport system substrate-binding protein